MKKPLHTDPEVSDAASRLLDALMDKDIDPRIKADIQEWFRSDMSEKEKQEAFLKYAEKINPYTGKLQKEALRRYNKLASRLGLETVSEKPATKNAFIWFRRVAAVLLPVLLVAGAYLLIHKFGGRNGNEMLVALSGQVQEVSLPDSSHITVSPHTELRYFESDESREVELSGEAFLKVTRDSIRPFFVSTENMKVRVLGTEFSVSEFPGGVSGVVSLYDGSVNVDIHGVDNVLSRGERLTYDLASNTIDISVIPSSEMLSMGYKPRLRFDSVTFGEVLDALSAYYRVTIETLPDVNTDWGSLSVDFENESLESSLALLMKMGKDNVAYSIQDGKIIISKK